jgi:hypothetical protein
MNSPYESLYHICLHQKLEDEGECRIEKIGTKHQAGDSWNETVPRMILGMRQRHNSANKRTYGNE